MKKRFLIFLGIMLLSMSLVLTGCGGAKNSGTKPADQKPAEKIIIRLGLNQPTSSPEYKGLEIFKQKLEQESGGRLQVQLFPSMQLGSMREQAEAVQIGSNEMTLQPVSVMTPFTPTVQIVDLPCLFPSVDVFFKVMEDGVGSKILDTMKEKGFVGLGFWNGGAKHFTTKNKEIHKPEDFKGVKMRVMPSPLLIAQYEAWGANPIPIEYAELYNALQQGVVDGQENPVQTIALNKYYEVQNTMILSGHGYMTYILVANKAWFEKLPADLQQLIIKVNAEASKEGRKLVADSEAKYLEDIKKSGIKIYELTPEEKKLFAKASQPVHEKFTKTELEKALLKEIYEKVEKYSK
ncbi:MAG: C4-dicarboxylate transporter substrate-binding protein [Peptococcaceae bacterium]|jgi:C4-dicarboxylate-binding protein DctP|nr:C4-dicarboxylate transporter substrate-binding protein [Peptococcaceae bacterium]